MQFTFDFVKMQMLLHNFHNICNVRFTLLDDSSKILCHSKSPSSICRNITSIDTGFKRCVDCDIAAINYVKEHNINFYNYTCHAGFSETIIPIRMQNSIVGYIFLGQYIHPNNVKQQWINTYEKLSLWHPDC